MESEKLRRIEAEVKRRQQRRVGVMKGGEEGGGGEGARQLMSPPSPPTPPSPGESVYHQPTALSAGLSHGSWNTLPTPPAHLPCLSPLPPVSPDSAPPHSDTDLFLYSYDINILYECDIIRPAG